MFHKKKSYCLEEFIKSSESITNGNTDETPTHPPTDISHKKKTPVKHSPFLGLFYTFLTSLFFTMTSVFVKQLSYISPGHLSLVRNAGVFSGCLPIAVYCVKEVTGPRKDRLLLLIRSFLGATALYLNLTAFRYLPLAEAAIVMSTSPAVTTVMARFYLKESCGLVQSFALIVTLGGVLLSVRLPELFDKRSDTSFDYTYLGGLASGVGCVILVSACLVTLRKMKDVHFSVTLFYFGLIGMIENATISFTTSTFVYPRCGMDQMSVMLIGIFGFLGHCTITLAIKAEAAGIVSVVKAAADIVIATIFQIIFFGGNLTTYNIAGACLVIFAVSIMGFRNWLLTLPEESKTSKRFKYFLL